MKKLFYFLSIFTFAFSISLSAQKIDKIKFFEEESMVETTLEMDMKDLLGKKQRERFLPATFTMKFADGTTATQKIEVSARGKFRRELCYMPGLKLNFRKDSTGPLAKFKELKLSNSCNTGDDAAQLSVKEFLVYKIYNLLTDKSLRVRPMKITFTDAVGKRKPYTQFGFMLEDIDDLAKRNGMVEIEGITFNTEVTDRDQMTLVTLFEYLIGNTDWSVPAYHNVKLIGPKDDNTVRPFVVAYDFDICGFVDPPYATIDEQLQDQISSVRERLNRGFPRGMEELKVTIKIFNDKKEQIYKLINNNEHLSARIKSSCISYLDDFYKIINDDREVEKIFVKGGRKN
jgi:hypothetical protein